MRTVPLGQTGVRVGRLALGCMHMGTVIDTADSFRMLDEFTGAGGTMVDTADCYAWWYGEPGSSGGESETVIGQWLRRSGRRDRIVLATKGSAAPSDPGARDETGIDWSRVAFEGAGSATLRRAVDGSLRRLGVADVDLYYVHIDDRKTPLEETLEALAGIVRAGKARAIGWSNVRTWRLEAIRQLCDRHGWPQPVAVQQQHSYLRRRPGLVNTAIVDDEQADYLTERQDLTLVSYSPILRGVYDDPGRRPGHEVLQAYLGADTEARLAELEAVAAELGARPSQVVLAWLMRPQAPFRCVPLAGPRTPAQLAVSLAATELVLDDATVARLDAAGSTA